MVKKQGIERFIRPDLASFGGYSAHTSPETLVGKVEVAVEDIIKLDANENPYGCSPRVARALAKYPNFNIYPDDGQTRLRKMLSEYCGVGPEHIMAGNGSNQIIDLILRLFLNPGDEIINCIPTFGIFKFSAQLCGGKISEVQRDTDFTVRVADIKTAITKKTKVIFLVNPNNPSGTITPRSDIMELLDTGLPVVIDEAYYEFSRETVASLVGKFDNLMVLRTFSKWAGLAGLRLGYGLFPVKIARYMLTIKMPYNINVAALVAVEESFKDIEYLKGNIEKIITERSRLFEELKKISWLKPVPSKANFILCRVEKGNSKDLKQRLQQKGILIRYYDETRLQDYIRISVGKPEQTNKLVEALKLL
jgi:histidinol-phosphate aminotransferase